jgi:hypothetical protein
MDLIITVITATKEEAVAILLVVVGMLQPMVDISIN